ncbi:MAG: hypothetical protein WBN53_17530 [Thermodesulfobacteriota bacterium]
MANKSIHEILFYSAHDCGIEAVEKVNVARNRRVGRKHDFLGWSVCNDLQLGRGQK